MSAARRKREPDPPEALGSLAGAVRSQGLARGYVVRGEERYFRERAIAILRAVATEGGYETCVHDAARGNPDFKLSRLIDDLSGGGLFAPRRLIVVRHPEDALKKAGNEPSALTRAVLGFVGGAQDGGCVVLDGESLRADHAAVKAIQKAGGTVLSLRKLWDGPPPWNPDPRQAELVQWLVRRAGEKGVRLSPAQAVYVCAATGNDLFALDEHVDRLRSLPGEELARVVGWHATTTPWTVSDHVLDGDLRRALGGIETLFQGGFQERGGRVLLDTIALANMLLGSLLRGARQALRLALELERGTPDADAVRALGIGGRPAAQQAALARARSRPSQAWRRLFEEVLELERRAKSGGALDANDFAHLVLAWAGGRREPAA